MNPPRLCIFTRAPVEGEVKRRLADRIGAAAALRAHETLVEDTLRRLGAVAGLVSELWLAGPDGPAVQRWVNAHGVVLRRQQGEDLGARMAHALSSAVSRAAVIVVGTDCPDIDSRYVHQAVAGLRDADVVLGPAEDGGYGLIGVTADIRPRLGVLFRDVPWGSAQVLTVTLQRCHDAGLHVTLLPTIWDVDTELDWHRYLAERSG